MNKFLLPSHPTSRFQLVQSPLSNINYQQHSSSPSFNSQEIQAGDDYRTNFPQRLHPDAVHEVPITFAQNGFAGTKGRSHGRKVAATGASKDTLLRENYLNQALLQNHFNEEISTQSEAIISALKIKKSPKTQISEDQSTSTDSTDEESKGLVSCAPPRRSRIMKFVNKDIEFYKEEHQTKLKTEICRNWEQTGMCRFGARCAFAHGIHELKSKVFLPCNYKTKICKQFKDSMYCPYGQRCQFLHILKTDANPLKEEAGVNYKDLLEEVVNNNKALLTSDRLPELRFGETTTVKRVHRLRVFENLANACAEGVEGAAPSLACNLN